MFGFYGLSRARFSVVCVMLLAGCASSPAMRAAEEGRFADLRKAIDEDLRSAELGADQARELAKLVLSAELKHAQGAVGIERVEMLASCAKEMEEALSLRTEQNDEVSAAAARLLVDRELVDVDDMWLRAEQAELAAKNAVAAVAWKAVHTRLLWNPEDGAERRRRMVDGDEEVRAAALRAAVDAGDAADTELLLEAARVDPYPLARTMAIRALGAIGGERAVLGLKDVWMMADEPRRQVITTAWATSRSIDAGGRRELWWAAETQGGTLAVAAAIALVRAKDPKADGAVAMLARAVETGSTLSRVYAINVSPLNAELVLKAIIKAQDDSDEAVALAAISRRLEGSGEGSAKVGTQEREAMIAKLVRMAGLEGSIRQRARASLARARVRDILPALERDVESKDMEIRKAAGQNLAAMGELARASVLLSDGEPMVRTAVGCAILSAPETAD